MIKRILSTSSYSFLSRIFITATNFFYIWFISKNLGTGALGIYGIIFFFYQFFASISSMNLYQFFGKEMAGVNDDKEKGKVYSEELMSVTMLGTVISLFVLILVLLLYSEIPRIFLVIVFPAGVLLGIERNLSGILLGTEKMRFEFLSNLVSFSVVLISVLLWKDMFLSIRNLLILKIVSQIFSVTTKLFPISYLFHFRFPSLKLRFIREGKYFWMTGLSNLFLRQADVFILSFFIGKSMLGSYFLAIRIYYFFGLAAEIFSFALTPFISRTYLGKEKSGFREFNLRMIKIFSLFAVLSSGFLYYGRYFIVGFFSKNREETVSYLTIFSVLVFFKFLSFITGNILTSTRFQNVRFLISSSSSLILIVLTLVLVPILNISGAVIARGVAEIFLFIAFSVSVYRVFGNYTVSK